MNYNSLESICIKMYKAVTIAMKLIFSIAPLDRFD